MRPNLESKNSHRLRRRPQVYAAKLKTLTLVVRRQQEEMLGCTNQCRSRSNGHAKTHSKGMP